MSLADLPPDPPHPAKLPAAAPEPPTRPSLTDADVRRAARAREATVTDWLRRLSGLSLTDGRFSRSG